MTAMQSLTPSFTTPDLPRCLALYRDALGFRCTSEYAQDGRLAWAELTNGPVVIMLLAAGEPPVDDARHDAHWQRRRRRVILCTGGHDGSAWRRCA